MYLRTPKRYQVGHKRRHMFSTRWLWLWILTPLVAVGGWLVYQNQDQFGPPVREFISNTFDNARGGIATMVAPTPLPTTNPTDRITRGDNAWSQGAIEQAITEYGAAAQSAPNDERVHFRYTYALLIEHQDEKALTAADHAVTADPFSADAWAIRALALERNGRYPEAVASALQALSIDADNAYALAFMAQAYLDSGQPSLAEEKANQAVDADPENPEAYYARALFNYSSSYDFYAALTDFQMAYELAPNLPHIANDLAWTNWQLEDYDASLDTWETVLESNPNNLDALYALGRLQYQINGDPQKAEDYLNRCTQVDADNIPCLNYLATVQIVNGSPQEAARSYQTIIDAGTDDPIYYLRAGRTYANLGECNSAAPLLRAGYAMELSVTEPDAERLAAFEEFMGQCNMPFTRTRPESSGAEPTDNAPLLIPLGS